MRDALVWQVLWVAVLTDLATGLGALPFAVVRRFSDSWRGMMTAVAAGMMLSASVFTLTGEALQIGAVRQVLVGLIAGAAFFSVTARLVHRHNWCLGSMTASESRQSILMLVAMFVHSIPEGVAVSMPLRARGFSVASCAGYAILTSLPQPIAAVPAYLLVSMFKPLLPLGLGFAGGAMIFLVISELLPDSLERCTNEQAAWGMMIGLTGMLWITGALIR